MTFTYNTDPPWGILQCLTAAMGRQIQIVNGTPTTRLSQDLSKSATTVNVESTLGFPTEGSVWIGKRLHAYSGKTTTTLTFVEPVDGLERILIVGTGTLVSLKASSVVV